MFGWYLFCLSRKIRQVWIIFVCHFKTIAIQNVRIQLKNTVLKTTHLRLRSTVPLTWVHTFKFWWNSWALISESSIHFFSVNVLAYINSWKDLSNLIYWFSFWYFEVVSYEWLKRGVVINSVEQMNWHSTAQATLGFIQNHYNNVVM